MSDQITITLTAEDAKELKKFDLSVMMAMNKLCLLSEVFDEWPGDGASLSSPAWIGLGAILDEISLSLCGKERSFDSVIKQLPPNEPTGQPA